MKANELRIGNLFQEQNSKEIISVIGLEKKRIIFSGIFLEKWQAEPIPLNEDWLLRFGFIIVNFRGIEASKENSRYSVKKVEDYDSLFFCDGEKVLTAFKYVHQLQNLYFALTNEELL